MSISRVKWLIQSLDRVGVGCEVLGQIQSQIRINKTAVVGMTKWGYES